MDTKDIDIKLDELRTKWKNKTGDPRILKLQARCLLKAKEIIEKRRTTLF